MKTCHIYILTTIVLLNLCIYSSKNQSVRILEDDFDDADFEQAGTASKTSDESSVSLITSATNSDSIETKEETSVSPDPSETATSQDTSVSPDPSETATSQDTSVSPDPSESATSQDTSSSATTASSSQSSQIEEVDLPIDDKFVNAYKSRKDYPAKYIKETEKVKVEFNCFAKYIYPYVNKLSGLLQANILYAVTVNKEDPKTYDKYCVHPQTFKLEYSEGVKRTWKFFSTMLGENMKKVRKSVTCALAASKQLKANLDFKPIIKPNSKVSQSLAKFLKCAGSFSAQRLRFFLMPLDELQKMHYTKTLENNKTVTGFKASLDEARNLVACFIDYVEGQISYNKSYYTSLKTDIFETLSKSESCLFNSEEFCWANPSLMKKQFSKYSDEDWKIIESDNRSEPDNKKYKDAIELVAKAKKLYKRIHTLTQANAQKVIVDCELQGVAELKDLAPEDKTSRRFLTVSADSNKSTNSQANKEDNESILDQVLPESLINMQTKCYDTVNKMCKDKGDLFTDYKQKKDKDAKVPAACRSSDLQNDLKNKSFIENCYAYIIRNFAEDNGFTINYAKLENFYASLPSSRRLLEEAVTVETSTYIMSEDEEKSDKTNSQLHKLEDPITDDITIVDGNTSNSLADENAREKEFQDEAEDLTSSNSTKLTVNLIAIVLLALLI